jgi:hypothetical protein
MFLEEGGILPVLLGVFAFAGSLEAQVFSVNYPSFSDCTGLQLNSSAACTGGHFD